MNPLDMHGKTALVTGGASGIGAAVVALFQELGASVCCADLPHAAERAGAVAVHGDVSSAADVARMTAQARQLLGGAIDVLVNCAGIADTYTPTVEQTPSSWQRIVDVDLTGTYLMCQAAGAHMVARRRGAIVNIASIVGLGGFPRRNAYGASKAGVINLTRCLANEWGASGVRVNCVAPGYIRTPMVDRLVTEKKVDIRRVEGRTPLARMGEPVEIARAIAYLASDWSAFVTGATLAVDGGWSAFSGAGDVATA